VWCVELNLFARPLQTTLTPQTLIPNPPTPTPQPQPQPPTPNPNPNHLCSSDHVRKLHDRLGELSVHWHADHLIKIGDEPE